MSNEKEIFTIAGKRMEVRHNINISKTCVRCCFNRGGRECGALSDCRPVPCLNFQNLEEGYAYFVPAEESPATITEENGRAFCRNNCIGYQQTGRCFADGDCKAKQEAESKVDITPESDFEAEYTRYMESRKDDVSGHAVTINIKDLARHFAEWGVKRFREQIAAELTKFKWDPMKYLKK